MLLLLALACDPSKDGTVRSRPADTDADPGADTDPGGDTDPGDDTDPGGDTDTAPPGDADGDGADERADCNDADASIYPGAAEVCDGVDQDCDGAADDGIPSDGAGCRDPGWPAFPATVGTVHVTLRTGTGTYDGTDDGGISVCLSAGLCVSPYKEEWNDLEPGVLDVSTDEGVAVDRATLDRFSIVATDGGDLWRPVGAQVSLDGELVYCRDLDLDVGSESGETASWTDPAGLTVGCDTVFDSPLTLGPMVGAVGPDRARLWYRTDTTRHVALYVAESEAALAGSAAVHHGYPTADRDFTAVADVVGLAPDRRYAYALEIDGERFGPWSFRTAPADGASGVFRLGFGSCAKDEAQPVFGAILAWDPDIFLFIGDNHYANTGERDGLRQFYRQAHATPLRSDVLAETSILATWDDHDYTGNNTDGTATTRDTALRVFEEYWANASFGTEATPGTFTRQTWGAVELFILDDRYYRGLDGTLLGAAQEAWLLDALATSPATFKLVASGSQFTPYGSSDSWAQFPDSWDTLREAIVRDRVEGVVLLSGDIHRFEARTLTPASGGYVLPEITSSSLAYPTPAGCGSDSNEPDRVLCLDEGSGFVGIEIDTSAADPTFVATYFDTAGSVQATWSTTRSALALP